MVLLLMILACSAPTPEPSKTVIVGNPDAPPTIDLTCPDPIVENQISCPAPVVNVAASAPQVNVTTAPATFTVQGSTSGQTVLVKIRNEPAGYGLCVESAQYTQGCHSRQFFVDRIRGGILSEALYCATMVQNIGYNPQIEPGWLFDMTDCCPDGYTPLGMGPDTTQTPTGNTSHTLLCERL